MFRNLSAFLLCAFAVQCLADPNCSQRPNKDELMGCCAKPAPLKEIIAKCSAKHPMDHGHPNLCFGECVFNETGFSANGVIQKDKISGIIGDLYKEIPDMIPIANGAIEKCGEIVRARIAKGMERKPEGADQCNHVPAMHAGCFFAETIINCPASAWQNTDDCNHSREFMKACPMPPNGPKP